jgi:hypothetical protein
VITFRPVISCVVEGFTDEAIVRRLVESAGGEVGDVYGLRGKDYILTNISGYNSAARFAPWFVLIDMDADPRCVADYRDSTLAARSAMMMYRVAVRQVEAWLLADRIGCATFLGVPQGRIVAQPEQLSDPKAEVVRLARRSRTARVRDALVPKERSGRPVGRGYATEIAQFASTTWNPVTAARAAPSLSRCIRRLEEFVRTADAEHHAG